MKPITVAILLTTLALTFNGAVHGQTPKPAVDAFGDALPEGAMARLGTVRFRQGEAPALAMLVVLTPGSVLTRLGLEPIYATPLALMVSWWILLGMGPRLQDWRLTGNHRITMTALAKANMTK